MSFEFSWLVFWQIVFWVAGTAVPALIYACKLEGDCATYKAWRDEWEREACRHRERYEKAEATLREIHERSKAR